MANSQQAQQVLVGVDMVEVARFTKFSPRFFKRMFSPEEIAYCEHAPRPLEHYAARFAAREAVLKALGCGWAGVGLQDVSVALTESGKPIVLLRGKPRELADKLNIKEIALSLSHTAEVAVANAVAIPTPPPVDPDEPTQKDQIEADFKAAREIVTQLEKETEQNMEN